MVSPIFNFLYIPIRITNIEPDRAMYQGICFHL
jgi:hypothetical protein